MQRATANKIILATTAGVLTLCVGVAALVAAPEPSDNLEQRQPVFKVTPTSTPTPTPTPTPAPEKKLIAPETLPPLPLLFQYSSCKEARADGAAPLHEGDPGFSYDLDRDGDGVACE